jgi:CheY-like chemotaxis protein
VDTILVVEDDADSRRFFRTALTVAGYRVIEAGDGLDALRLLDSQRPAAVVLDLHLPLVSGRVVLQEIAAHAHTRDIPVVIVTGNAGPHDDLQNAFCVLTKPVTPERLVMTVRRCMKSGSSSHGV